MTPDKPIPPSGLLHGHDIIPDIHGEAGKLKSRLSALGYRQAGGAWWHPDADRHCILLGDFIDRGPDNAKVIETVRRMIDTGAATAIMGNHELNAIHFHTPDPETGSPLRHHSSKNLIQHQTILKEFPPGAQRTTDTIDWMKTLPLFLEHEDFRLVHACWNEATVNRLGAAAAGGRFCAEQLVRAGRKGDTFHTLAETTTKGPEVLLPDGHAFTDKDGTRRREVRLQWWKSEASSWADLAISVPEPKQLPKSPLPQDVIESVYPRGAKPVFFGHYWLSGRPVLQASNALCLDYSARTEGLLVSYHIDEEQCRLDLRLLSGHLWTTQG